VASDKPIPFPIGADEDAERLSTPATASPENGAGSDLNGVKEPIFMQSERKEHQMNEFAWPSARPDQDEAVRLLREMRHDLARLVKISEKASRRNKAHLDYLEGTKWSRRWGLILLIVIAVLMVIQVLQMAGYGPGSGNSDDNTQTLLRVHTNTLTLQRIHTAG
jgi:hypothetical protein